MTQINIPKSKNKYSKKKTEHFSCSRDCIVEFNLHLKISENTNRIFFSNLLYLCEVEDFNLKSLRANIEIEFVKQSNINEIVVCINLHYMNRGVWKRNAQLKEITFTIYLESNKQLTGKRNTLCVRIFVSLT